MKRCKMSDTLKQKYKEMDKLGLKTYASYQKYLINEKFKNNVKLNTRDLIDSFTKIELAQIVQHLYDKPRLVTHNNFNTVIKSFSQWWQDSRAKRFGKHGTDL